MKRKITYILSLLMTICMLCACGTESEANTYNGMTVDELRTEAETSITNINNYLMLVGEDYEEYQKTVEGYEETTGMTEGQIVYNILTTNGMSASMKNIDAELDAVPMWLDYVEEYGEPESLEGKDFKVTKSGGTLTTDMTLKFGKKDITFELVYDSVTMEVTGISLTPVETMGTKLAKAGQNTLISISIVFAVLILISLIIYCFRFIALIGNKDNSKKEDKKNNSPAVEIPVQQEEDLTSDEELVAVIAAAIAASEGTTTDGFVVRSINRR